MPAAELIDNETAAAVTIHAIEVGLDAGLAVVLIERLLVAGVIVAPLSESLDPDAEARLSLARFRGALPPTPPDPEEVEDGDDADD